MLIKKQTGYEIPSSEITPKHIYQSRRNFMKGAALSGVAALLAACSPKPSQVAPESDVVSGVTAVPGTVSANTDELGDPLNSFEDVTTYNNYYEFSTSKSAPAKMAANFPTSPWQVEVSGLLKKPKAYNMEDLLAFEQEERIYRLRCVERWSMVIPWVGFSLADLIKRFQPTSKAKYVEFLTLFDPSSMAGQRARFTTIDWPYREALRMDEAMNPLTLLAVGVYGNFLPPQNGAPIRLVVPWKYGFKSIKSIVKIRFREQEPATSWNMLAPQEYGFYANVNPDVHHPRWRQDMETRLPQTLLSSSRIPTQLFNGYAEQVASLYKGMDLTKNY